MLKTEHIQIVNDWPRHGRVVRVWDFAGTEKKQGNDPDYTVGVFMTLFDGRVWIVDIVRGRWEAAGVESVTKQTAMRDGQETPILLKEEPGSSGKAVSAHYQRRVLLGYAVRAKPDTGSKVLRAQPLAAAIEAGNVSIVRGAWNDAFLDEARVFPAGAHDDQVDAAASAFLELTQSGVALIAV